MKYSYAIGTKSCEVPIIGPEWYGKTRLYQSNNGVRYVGVMSFFLKSGVRATIFGRVQKIPIFWTCGCPYPILTLRKVRGGEFNVLRVKLILANSIGAKMSLTLTKPI